MSPSRVTFGKVDLCTRCRKKGRRKSEIYSTGTIQTTLEYAHSMGYEIKRRYGSDKNAPVDAVCPVCKGKGYTERIG